MTVEKSELKMLMANQIGSDLGEALHEALAKAREARGAASALRAAEQAVASVSRAVAAEWKEGKVQLEPEDPVAAGKYAVAKLMDAARQLHDMGENAAASVLRAEGEAQGVQRAIAHVASIHKAEAGKLAAASQAEAAAAAGSEPVVGGPRQPGSHPGLPMKAAREAEAAAARPSRPKRERASRPASKRAPKGSTRASNT